MFVNGERFKFSLVFRDKHSSLLQKLKITAVISFILQAPGGKTTCHKLIELFMSVILLIYECMDSDKEKRFRRWQPCLLELGQVGQHVGGDELHLEVNGGVGKAFLDNLHSILGKGEYSNHIIRCDLKITDVCKVTSRGRIHNSSFSSILTNAPKKLVVCHWGSLFSLV